MTTANMTPVDWAKRPIEKYADFSGRAPRPEYWWYTAALIVATIVVSMVEGILGIDDMVGPYGPLSLILMLGLLVPGVAVTVRRLHDSNRTGWWILVAAIPYFIVGVLAGMAGASGSMAALGTAGMASILAFAGMVLLLIFMVLPGTPGDNRYGPPPAAGDGSAATT
jgi:uncharacterized membrane protein YhaH (DUF805 family)